MNPCVLKSAGARTSSRLLESVPPRLESVPSKSVPSRRPFPQPVGQPRRAPRLAPAPRRAYSEGLKEGLFRGSRRACSEGWPRRAEARLGRLGASANPACSEGLKEGLSTGSSLKAGLFRGVEGPRFSDRTVKHQGPLPSSATGRRLVATPASRRRRDGVAAPAPVRLGRRRRARCGRGRPDAAAAPTPDGAARGPAVPSRLPGARLRRLLRLIAAYCDLLRLIAARLRRRRDGRRRRPGLLLLFRAGLGGSRLSKPVRSHGPLKPCVLTAP